MGQVYKIWETWKILETIMQKVGNSFHYGFLVMEIFFEFNFIVWFFFSFIGQI